MVDSDDIKLIEEDSLYKRASGEFLDFWAKIVEIKRMSGEGDDELRKRIIDKRFLI